MYEKWRGFKPIPNAPRLWAEKEVLIRAWRNVETEMVFRAADAGGHHPREGTWVLVQTP